MKSLYYKYKPPAINNNVNSTIIEELDGKIPY